MWKFYALRLNHNVDGDLHTFCIRPRWLHENVEPKGKCAWFHLGDRRSGEIRLQFIATLGQIFLDEFELTPLLSIPNDGLGNRSAESVRHNGGRAIPFFFRRPAPLCKPREDIQVEHLQENPRDFLKELV